MPPLIYSMYYALILPVSIWCSILRVRVMEYIVKIKVELETATTINPAV